jgi:hypothetical protein
MDQMLTTQIWYQGMQDPAQVLPVFVQPGRVPPQPRGGTQR